MWAVGCIFGELLVGEPLFPGMPVRLFGRVVGKDFVSLLPMYRVLFDVSWLWYAGIGRPLKRLDLLVSRFLVPFSTFE